MYDETLILNDGTTVNVTSGLSDGFLWLWFTGYSMQEAANLFLDESKTVHFTINSTEYDCFTDCRLIQRNTEGKLSICLTRSEPNE